MKLLVMIVFILTVITATVFILLNLHTVDVSLYFSSIPLPLALVLALELFAGILIGILVTFIYILRLKAQYAQLK